MLAVCFVLPMMRSNLPLGRSCNCSAIGASTSIAASAAPIPAGWLGAMGGASVLGAGGFSKAAAGLSDREPEEAGDSGSVIRVPGSAFDAGAVATAGEGSTTGCSESDFGPGVATTAGEGATTGWSGLGLAAAAG